MRWDRPATAASRRARRPATSVLDALWPDTEVYWSGMPLYCFAMVASKATWRVMLGMALVGMVSAGAMAQRVGSTTQQSQNQSRERIRPPIPESLEPPNRIMVYGVALVVGGVAIGLAIMPSRRSHTD